MKIHSLCLLVAVYVLTACMPAAPTASPQPTATLPAPTATSEPLALPTEIPSTPTLQTNCTSAALFVQDVTIPDMTVVQAGETFTKIWRLKNTGTCTWNARYNLVFVEGDRLQAAQMTPLSETAPGGTLDIALQMTAPALDGLYTGIYELRDPQGQTMPVGKVNNIWVKIVVGTILPTPLPGSTSVSGTPALCKPARDDAQVGQLLFLINDARAKANLPALALNSQLTAAAQAHSEDMACNGFRGHTGSDGSSISTRVARQGYVAAYVLETIYAGGSAQNAFDWWMNDDLHRRALLDPNVNEVGIGHANFSLSLYGDYFTVDLASR